MSIQQLLAQLADMGFESDVLSGGLSGLTGSQIETGVGSAYSDSVQDMLNASMFQTINPELLKSASIGAYSPMFQQKQSSLIPQLMAQLGGQQAKKAYGGFAGSGGAQMQQQQAKDVYGQGMQNTLTQAIGGKTQSLQTIQDIINQWQQTAQSFV